MNLNTTFYHGTYLEDALKIQRGGFRTPKARGRGAILGTGVYVSGDRSFAEGYAEDIVNDEEVDAAILHLRINPKKPLDIDSNNWPEDFMREYQARTRMPAQGRRSDYPVVGELAREMGYDAVVYDKGTTVVYDPSRIKVVRVESILASKTASYSYDRR